MFAVQFMNTYKFEVFLVVVHQTFQPCHSQETHGTVSAWTAKLATYKPGNEARDYFRSSDLPLVFWHLKEYRFDMMICCYKLLLTF